MHERSQAFGSNRFHVAQPCLGVAQWCRMMKNTSQGTGALQNFMLDAQLLLSKAQGCLQHLQLIDNDSDACLCLGDTLGTLARRAEALGLVEVARYTTELLGLLGPVCERQHLQATALPAVDECLTLLAWQLELLDASTGRLNLDTTEQTALLRELASALAQPFAHACATRQPNPQG